MLNRNRITRIENFQKVGSHTPIHLYSTPMSTHKTYFQKVRGKQTD